MEVERILKADITLGVVVLGCVALAKMEAKSPVQVLPLSISHTILHQAPQLITSLSIL